MKAGDRHRSVGRVAGALRRIGVFDGLWTLTATVGSKVQMLVLLGVAGRISGVAGLGSLVLALAIGTIAFAITDLGLISMAVRAYASKKLQTRRALVQPLVRRACADVLVGGCLAVLVVSPQVDEPWAWAGAICLYAVGLHASTVVTQAAYGMFKFRSGAAINGVVRIGTVPILAVLGVTGSPLVSLLVTLAISEFVIAGMQFRSLRISEAPRPELVDVDVLRVSRTWQMGATSLVNIVINKSDAFIVGLVGSAVVVGTYGLASQIENALTTVALVPAGALIAYSARGDSSAGALRRRMSAVVAISYVLLALPVLAAPQFFTQYLFGVGDAETLPLRICAAAGLMSCLASVILQQLVGLGHQAAVLKVWLWAGPVTVVALLLGTFSGGATGAALGAFARDASLLFISLLYLRSTRRRIPA